MQIVFFILFAFLCFLLYTFSIIQILLSLSCSIPLTKKLLTADILTKDNAKIIYKRNVFTIVIHCIIISAVTIPVIIFANQMMKIGFGCGILFAFLLSISQLGMHENNIFNYVTSYKDIINFEQINTYLEDLEYVVTVRSALHSKNNFSKDYVLIKAIKDAYLKC